MTGWTAKFGSDLKFDLASQGAKENQLSVANDSETQREVASQAHRETQGKTASQGPIQNQKKRPYTMKLTQKIANALQLPAGRSELFTYDDALGGFGLRIRAGGSRTWIYQFKIGPKSRRVTLGNASALSLTDARAAAVELHAKVKLGRDPAGEKWEHRARAVETVAAALQSYLAYQRKRIRPRSYTEVERHLLKNCKTLHNIPLTTVDRRTVASRLTSIATKCGDVTANRTRSSLSAFFAWAMREGLVDVNPVLGTNTQPERARDRVLADDELRTIWSELGSNDYSTIVRLLMLTGQRADEIASLSWSEIVDDKIILPAARTKNRREHVVPLSPMAQSMFDSRERGDNFVFGRPHGRPFRGWGVCKAALDQRIRDRGATLAPWTHHDLRRSMVTWLAESGTPPHVIEAVINHVSGHKSGVAGIYNRASYEPQKRVALEKWANHIDALVSGKRPSTVVTLRGA
jgi:integrase